MMWKEGQNSCISLGVILGVVLLTGLMRVTFRRRVFSTVTRTFVAELLATFQLCCCSHELQVLVELGPSNPSWPLTIIYFLSLVHGLTLVGAVSNPCGVLEQLALEQMPVGMSILKILAQMLGAWFSRTFMLWIWKMGISKWHYPERALKCTNPIHIALPEAFLVEMFCSFIFHSTMMHFQEIRLKFRIHLQAALITFLVFAGGSLTGAVFNPVLALSLHFQCFQNLFYNYFIVYCLGPSLGIMLMVLMFSHFLPWLHNMNRNNKNA
ncbi:aquaporin-11 [Monodelphis domestica]|uniref:Aquaporin n=1 Tax=Monodelphis domestica TaxID=13616 RepID=F7E9A8_MONDO|nr:aquaporin-11 [Monodelphis domestica]